MNDADFLVAVLSDGKPHTTNEILQASFKERGCGLTVHSRASDLRIKRGMNIECKQVGRVNGRNLYEYQFVERLPELLSSPSSSGTDISPSAVPEQTSLELPGSVFKRERAA